jgi:hypothetical protein
MLSNKVLKTSNEPGKEDLKSEHGRNPQTFLKGRYQI